jgi:hypothetical protein
MLASSQCSVVFRFQPENLDPPPQSEKNKNLVFSGFLFLASWGPLKTHKKTVNHLRHRESQRRENWGCLSLPSLFSVS